jgi:hypothetical protein
MTRGLFLWFKSRKERKKEFMKPKEPLQVTATPVTNGFMKVDSLEEFKEKYIFLHKQDLALQDGYSYIDVRESNVDGTMTGEMFDNAFRLKFLNERNKEFLAQVNEDELMEIVRNEYEQDKASIQESESQDAENNG